MDSPSSLFPVGSKPAQFIPPPRQEAAQSPSGPPPRATATVREANAALIRNFPVTDFTEEELIVYSRGATRLPLESLEKALEESARTLKGRRPSLPAVLSSAREDAGRRGLLPRPRRHEEETSSSPADVIRSAYPAGTEARDLSDAWVLATHYQASALRVASTLERAAAYGSISESIHRGRFSGEIERYRDQFARDLILSDVPEAPARRIAAALGGPTENLRAALLAEGYPRLRTSAGAIGPAKAGAA